MIQLIKESVDIVQIIGEYVHSLKKSGKNWVGLCPFHNDKHPSFSVSQEYGIYKCFSCGESGDIISFIEKIEGLSFAEAVGQLAKKTGIELSTTDNDYTHTKRHDFIVFNERIINLFQYFLLKQEEGKKPLAYLMERGIDKTIINDFMIGYAPKGYGRLEKMLLSKGFEKDFLVDSGLFQKDNDRLRTLFFDRIIFPIVNYKNECVGFGGRVLSDVKPKYINSPETIVYKKSRNLYGINTAKKHLKEENKVYIVEGYTDVISCYKNGVKNVVAPCGTAITKEQIKLLSRYVTNIILLLDGDDAGIKGVVKALCEAVNIENIKVMVLILPEKMDPDDFFKKYDYGYFRQFEKQSVDAFKFLIYFKTNGLDVKDYSNLIEILNFLFNYIKLWDSEIVRGALLRELSDYLDIDYEILLKEFHKYCSKLKKSGINDREKKEVIGKSDLDDLKKREIDLIILLLHYTDSWELVQKCSLMGKHFYYDSIRELYLKNLEQRFSDKKDLTHNCEDVIVSYIRDQLFNDELKQKEMVLKNNIIDRIGDIIKKYYVRQNEKIQEKIKLGVMYKDSELVKELQEEKIIISTEIRKLSKLQELKR